jgi:hypothetical protein
VGTTVHELKDVGRIRVPSGLEGPIEDRSTQRLRFSFRRYYPWYRFDAIGSGTPIRQELHIQISNPAAPAGNEPDPWAAAGAGNTVKPLDWRQDGPFRVAEGLYTMNTRRDKVVVVAMSQPAKAVTAGYRAWRRDASLEEAKRILQDAVQSLELSAPLSDLFHSEQSRPDREYHARLQQVESALAGNGLSLPALGEIREEKGFIMELAKDHNGEEQFVIIRRLGELPTAHAVDRANAAWSYDFPNMSRPQWLPSCGWYVQVKGKWEAGRVGSEPFPGDNLERRLIAGFTDPNASYFIAAARVLLREPQVEWLPDFLKRIPATEKRLREGKLVKPQ